MVHRDCERERERVRERGERKLRLEVMSESERGGGNGNGNQDIEVATNICFFSFLGGGRNKNFLATEKVLLICKKSRGKIAQSVEHPSKVQLY